jgi:hypothetical protein
LLSRVIVCTPAAETAAGVLAVCGEVLAWKGCKPFAGQHFQVNGKARNGYPAEGLALVIRLSDRGGICSEFPPVQKASAGLDFSEFQATPGTRPR